MKYTRNVRQYKMLLTHDKDTSSGIYIAPELHLDAIMKEAFVVMLLSVVGLTTAVYDEFCPSTGTVSVPFPTNCSEFILCTDGVGATKACMNDYWFDATLKFCRPQDVAHCENIPSNDVPQYVLDICSNLEVGQSIPAESCNEYYVCYGTKAFQMKCPNGQHYSRAYSSCMNPLRANCRAFYTMCVGEYPGFAFPSLTCEDYYVCSDSLMPEMQSCKEGLYFSANLQGCALPAESGCVNEYVPTDATPADTTPDDTTPDVTTPDDTTPDDTTPDDTTPEVTTPSDTTPDDTTQGSNCGPTCDASNTGSFFPHAECNKFYMCFDSKAMEFTCECGQYYNTAMEYCIQDIDKVCLS